jgi:hypothetical protein
VRLKNAYAGHKLPTGDPERHIRVDVSMIAGGKVAETRSIRIGQQWEWWPKARKVADTRLRPLEERVETLTFRAPKQGEGRLRISVTNVRMTEEAAKFHHLLGRYPIEARVQSFDHPLSLRVGEQSGLK